MIAVEGSDRGVHCVGSAGGLDSGIHGGDRDESATESENHGGDAGENTNHR